MLSFTRDKTRARIAAPLALAGAVGVAVLPGCAADHAAKDGVRAFYAGDFGSAAAAFRPGAERRPFDENSLLNNARLGMAELAAGRAANAVRPLGVAYQLLESGGVNDSGRMLAATVLHEGVRVYKGEPFEQALTYAALAWANALRGDWENVRICARASVRRLSDYGGKPEGHAGAPETDFAMGYFLEGLANAVLGEGDLSALDRAVSLNAGLGAAAERIRAREFNAVVIIEAGRGPEKESYGDDDAQTRWTVIDTGPGSARVDVSVPPGSAAAPGSGTLGVVADVNRMSETHRWNNLEDARSFKSGLGTVMVVGGVGTAVASEDKGAQIAGLSAAAAGLLMKALSSADVRHNELLPAEVFVAVVRVPESGADLSVTLGSASRIEVPGVRPGTPGAPSVVYARVVPRARIAARAVTSWGEIERVRARNADAEAERIWDDVSGGAAR